MTYAAGPAQYPAAPRRTTGADPAVVRAIPDAVVTAGPKQVPATTVTGREVLPKAAATATGPAPIPAATAGPTDIVLQQTAQDAATGLPPAPVPMLTEYTDPATTAPTACM